MSAGAARAQLRVMAWPATVNLAESTGAEARQYMRHRPEGTVLYEVVRDNVETLYGAMDDGTLEVRLSKHAKRSDPIW